MTTQRVLTGITTTGTPHLGNFVGAIRPAIAASRDPATESFFFLADYHALIKCQDPAQVRQSSKEIAATWLALGLDTERAVFYRQSDIPEITELNWILCCNAAKGLMNRAHAYKAATQANEEAGEDPDFGVTMGLFNYPVLMAADILMFSAQRVPVGKDQIQHMEMARDIAQRFNHNFAPLFTLPEAVVDDHVAVLQGLDGRKMSKSYHNTIPLFLPEKQLRKAINKIKTNLLEPGEPKDPDDSTVFQIWSAFASAEDTARMRADFEAGIAWGEAKRQLFELVNATLAPARERYEALLNDPGQIEAVLQRGAERARAHSVPLLAQVREAVGIGAMR
ncbi:MAG TPA: tryptophan--tRNA ligase [Halieaceae bacterium]|jgi:tryptophanyl-tRNA synthetase|uniref:tryptophan--tRNA ligase n=1 Tax=Haliea TaxID=475794 RepID=UPI000C46D31C|nr:tryptophan--tRNA ligase [Haliea sp.]HBQ40316.1 tryptophan--tRNA ligase [Halieaceae bacterium]MAD63427.1 tryptophan--tRNA ligase [Haliea sp.]MAY93505.1 tryptophan--tRNA ligase [Haliea sp.]MBK41264.1 tryptophan--tRNA ligase [Haliea sp.]MBP71821.1 tryptophan--tRNA ligase [Haliea sp.]|tara:strand:+ start:1078 stop:2085 length:1008 start_codon:yes stop_codon:yes gene_type:complete